MFKNGQKIQLNKKKKNDKILTIYLKYTMKKYIIFKKIKNF